MTGQITHPHYLWHRKWFEDHDTDKRSLRVYDAAYLEIMASSLKKEDLLPVLASTIAVCWANSLTTAGDIDKLRQTLVENGISPDDLASSRLISHLSVRFDTEVVPEIRHEFNSQIVDRDIRLEEQIVELRELIASQSEEIKQLKEQIANQQQAAE